MRLPKIKFARAPVAFAAIFVVFSIVLSLASPKLHVAFSGGSGPYRWRNDDGSETAATFAAAEGAPITIAKNTPLRLRVAAGNDGTQTDLTEASSLANGGNSICATAIDSVHGYAYISTCAHPSVIKKVLLGAGAAAPTVVGSVTLNAGEDDFLTAVIDPDNGYAYFGQGNNGVSAKIVKVALGAGAAAPTRVGVVALDITEGNLRSSAIDIANGFAYFGTNCACSDSGTNPGTVVKVALGSGNNPPTRVGAVTLNAGEDNLTSGVIDPGNGFAYFGTGDMTGVQNKIIKVALGTGNNPPTRVGSAVMPTGEGDFYTGVIDPGNGYAYFSFANGLNATSVSKIALGTDNAAPTRVGTTLVDAGENNFSVRYSSIDTANGFMYVGGSNNFIIKVALGTGNNLPSRVSALTLGVNENNLLARGGSGIDATNGYIYPNAFNAGELIKISIAPKASYRLEYGLKTSTCGAIAAWIQVPATATFEAWQMAASANVTDGQATTHLAGLTDPNTSFTPGQVKTTSSQASVISLGESQFTQMEYSVEPTNNANGGENYCFRLTDAGTVTPLTGTTYPEATIAATAPPTPTLSTPADNSYTSDPSVFFSWSSEAGATSYILSAPGLVTNTPGTNSWNQTNVNYGTYTWTVASHGAGGDSAPSVPFTFTEMAPPAPVSPADGTFTSDTAQTITWSAVTGATSYHVYVTEQGGVFGGFFNTTTTDTHVDLAGLNPGHLYTWNITTVDALSVQTNFSTDSSFTVLNAPGISFPPDGTFMSNRSPSLTWDVVTGASGYHLFVTSQGGSTGDILDETTAATTVDLSNLATGAYEWHVTSIDGLGHETAPSAATTFTILAPPSLTSPNDGATLNNASPTLNWDAVTGASGYHVTVTSQGGTTGDTFDGGTINNSLDLVGLANGTYDWFVTTEDAGANQTAPSATRAFTINVPAGGTPPATPIQDSPTSGFVTASGDVNFTWESVAGADHYNIYTPGVFSVGTVPTTWLQHGIPPGDYTWFVVAVNGSGTPSDPSPSWNYTVLGPPSLSSPPDTASFASASPTLSWGAVTGATSYHVFVTMHGGVPGAVHDEVLSGTSLILSGLAAGEYDWYVTTVDGTSVETAPSSTFTFTVLAPPSLLTPTDAATVSAAPTLTWNTVADASGYHVFVTTHNGVPGAVHNEVVAGTTLGLSGLAVGEYDWYVTTVDGASVETGPSTTFNFTVAAVPSGPPGSSPSGNPTATAPVITPAGNNNGNTPPPSPVEVGTTDATFHFTNPGNATTFNLYDAPPSSSPHLVATENDPNATAITETGLQPNTTYSDRVISAVAYGIESAPSPPFPSFTTLLPTPDTVAPTYDPAGQILSLAVTGSFPNLVVGRSGIDFVIKDGSGKTLFDSGYVQTPGPGSLASVDLEPGGSYTVIVTTRNSAGNLGGSKDYPINIPAANFGAAKIVLTKTAVKTDIPVITNAATGATERVTKEIKYTVTAANQGSGLAKNFVMTDLLAAGINFKAGSFVVTTDLENPGVAVETAYDPQTRTVTAAIAQLKPHESFVVSFMVTPVNGAAGSIKNIASATWEE